MELRKAEVRWIRAVPKPGEMTEEETKSEELYKRFQGILNKLTPQKFQALAEQALKLDITTEERLRGCIDKIFSKVREVLWVQVKLRCHHCTSLWEGGGDLDRKCGIQIYISILPPL